jgi:SAM-dependent methyltransferase
MSDSARPGPSQVPPTESRSLEAAVDPIAAAFSVPPEAAEPEVMVVTPAKPGVADADSEGKELLLLQNDADEPPIYFEPDSDAGPFMPAMTPAPAVAVANISVDLDDDDEPVPPTVNSPSELPTPSPVVELTPPSGEVPAPGSGAASNGAASNGAASPSADGAVTAADGPPEPAPVAVAVVAVAAAAIAPVAVAPVAAAPPAAPAPEEPASASAGPPTERSAPSEPPAIISSVSSIPASAPISSLQDGQPLPSSDPGRRAVSHSTSVPPPRVRTNRSQRPGGSARPPGMIEPARIIAVLGSDVPAYTKGAANGETTNEEIEDLDDSEAQELLEGVPSERQTQRSADSSAMPAVEARGDAAPVSVPIDSSTTPLPSESTQKRPKPPSPPSARAARKAAEDAVGKKAWWEDMFSEEFLRAIPVLSPPQLERETAFVARSLNVPKGKRLLDLACGAGQHAVELAARGYSVVGYDLSQAQLAWASELAVERGQALEFMHGDMRDLDFTDAFDGVYCWNTSFGFFEEEKNMEIARRVLRSLKPGGRFLLDVVNRDFIVSQQPGQTWFEGDGCVCIDDVGIDFVSSRINVKRTLMLDNGRNRECNYSIRLYSLHELGKLLTDVGFNVLQASGRPELPGVFMGPTSPRIILLAAKPAA